jgi:hypothetical protein
MEALRGALIQIGRHALPERHRAFRKQSQEIVYLPDQPPGPAEELYGHVSCSFPVGARSGRPKLPTIPSISESQGRSFRPDYAERASWIQGSSGDLLVVDA